MFVTLNPIHLDLLHTLYAGGLPPLMWAAVDDARAYRRLINGVTHTVVLAYITEYHPIEASKASPRSKKHYHKEGKSKLVWEPHSLTFIYLCNPATRYVRGFPGMQPVKALRFAAKALKNAANGCHFVRGQE